MKLIKILSKLNIYWWSLSLYAKRLRKKIFKNSFIVFDCEESKPKANKKQFIYKCLQNFPYQILYNSLKQTHTNHMKHTEVLNRKHSRLDNAPVNWKVTIFMKTHIHILRRSTVIAWFLKLPLLSTNKIFFVEKTLEWLTMCQWVNRHFDNSQTYLRETFFTRKCWI